MAVRIKERGRFCLRVSSGFIMLLALLFWLDEGVGLLFPALLAATFHELGHMAAILLAGGSVKWIRLTATGAEMRVSEDTRFSYGKDAAVALAGPLASFLFAWLAVRLRFWLLAAMCAGQGIFNLLPMGPLDGGRVLYAVISGCSDCGKAERVISAVSALIVGILLGIGLVLLRQYGNPTLTITAGWMLWGIFQQEKAN